jgi:hypothetical protein
MHVPVYNIMLRSATRAHAHMTHQPPLSFIQVIPLGHFVRVSITTPIVSALKKLLSILPGAF